MGDDEREPERVSGELVPQPAENSDSSARKIGRPFPPGVSGNPGGRPGTVSEYRAFLSDVDEEEANGGHFTRRRRLWQRAYEIAMKGRSGDAIRAIEFMTSYDMGKPPSPITVTDANGKEMQIRGIIIMPAERGDSDEEGGDHGE